MAPSLGGPCRGSRRGHAWRRATADRAVQRDSSDRYRRAAEAVWPWLVQVGFGRAGFYSYDLLDSLGHPSADCILQEWQHLTVGNWVPMSPTPSETTAFRVAGFELNRWLLWAKPDSTWAWRLQPTSNGGTRLIARLRCFYDFQRPVLALFTVFLIEVGDFAMFRKMLLGIRERAQRHLSPSGAGQL